MQDRKRTRSIYRITLVGSFTNFLLVTFKFIAGFMGHSAAMIADAVHSLSDFITDAVVLVCVHLANKPSDKSHDYGHEKYETIATAIIGTGLLIVGTGICWSGVVSVWNVLHGGDIEEPGIIALWMALLSVTLKELIFHITLYVGKKADSQIVIANAWHHRSDALSSVTTALGIGGAIFLGEKWRVLDPLSAIIVSLFIIKVSVNLLRPCIAELTESSLPEEIENQIAKLVQEEPEVSGMHNLRTRRIGNRYAIEMHVRMNGKMSLYDAHVHASHIEEAIKERFGEDTHVGIHVEPTKKDGHYIDPNGPEANEA